MGKGMKKAGDGAGFIPHGADIPCKGRSNKAGRSATPFPRRAREKGSGPGGGVTGGKAVRDVTEKKNMEEALAKSEERYRNIFENAVEGIFQSTAEGRYVNVNPAFAHIFGYDTPQEMLSDVKDIGEQLYANSEDRKRATRMTEEKGVVRGLEVECRKRNGEIIWVSLNAKPVRDRSSGKVVFFEGTIEDITERKRTNEELQQARADLEKRVAERTKELETANRSLRAENAERRKAEEEVRKLTKAVETTPTAILLTDLSGNIEYVNPSIRKLVWAFSDGEILGSHILDYTDEAGRKKIKSEIIPALLSEKQWRGEINIRTKDGATYATEMIASLVPDDAGNPKYFLGNIFDITRRKRMEEELQAARAQLETRVLERTAQLEDANRTLQASLKEKEVLIKEIHHRVKNNLQIISSLLKMQSAQIKDPEAYELFRESQDRIRSIALVHEKLYQSDDLSEIDYEAYIKKLTDHLLRSYGASLKGIRVDISAKGVYMDVNTAIPCSLIINELVSNALKHAFAPDSGGKITIRATYEAESGYRLDISDDGRGFPEGMDHVKSASLGLQLVSTLVDQLKGSMELIKGNGTSFRIDFPYIG